MNFPSSNYTFGFRFWSFDIHFQLALNRRRPFGPKSGVLWYAVKGRVERGREGRVGPQLGSLDPPVPPTLAVTRIHWDIVTGEGGDETTGEFSFRRH